MYDQQLFTVNVIKDKRFLIFAYQETEFLIENVVNQVDYFICAGGLLELTITVRNDTINVGLIIVILTASLSLGTRPFKNFITNMKIWKKVEK